jgi:hypothetical protein
MTRNAILPAILCFIGPGFTSGYIYGYKFALEPGLRDLRMASCRHVHELRCNQEGFHPKSRGAPAVAKKRAP